MNFKKKYFSQPPSIPRTLPVLKTSISDPTIDFYHIKTHGTHAATFREEKKTLAIKRNLSSLLKKKASNIIHPMRSPRAQPLMHDDMMNQSPRDNIPGVHPLPYPHLI